MARSKQGPLPCVLLLNAMFRSSSLLHPAMLRKMEREDAGSAHPLSRAVWHLSTREFGSRYGLPSGEKALWGVLIFEPGRNPGKVC